MQYRIVEVPAFTCIEDIVSGNRLVTIHTKTRVGSEWVPMSHQDMEKRKNQILDIFNLESKLIEILIVQGWDEVQGQIVFTNDPDGFMKFGSWSEAIVGILSEDF